MITIHYFTIIGLICYLAGSIPTAYIITKLIKGVDIRNYGSGNPGATNVFRIAGKTAGIATLAIDFVKGFLPLLLIKLKFPQSHVLIIVFGLLAIAGHIWPVFLSFRGGKGVATSAGVLFAILPDISAIGAVSFLIVFMLTKTISVCSITAAITVIIACWILNKYIVMNIFITIIAVIVIARHIPNIKRLIRGNEPKTSDKPNE